MKKLFFLLFLFSSSPLFAQDVNWQQTHGWRIYDLHDKKGMHVRSDSLPQYTSIPLEDDSVKYFLQGATEIKPGDEPVWMGAIIVSYVDSSGNFHKVDVSVYGGFFYEEKIKRYYQVRDEIKEEWMGYLMNKETALER